MSDYYYLTDGDLPQLPAPLQEHSCGMEMLQVSASSGAVQPSAACKRQACRKDAGNDCSTSPLQVELLCHPTEEHLSPCHFTGHALVRTWVGEQNGAG